MSNYNNNYVAGLITNAIDARNNAMGQLANLCDGGRKQRQSAIKQGVNRYSDPDYIEACRTDARRNLSIWSRY